MNVQKVIRELEKRYPGKNVVITDPKNPTEIICEIEPGRNKSVAVAVVDETRLHYHKKLTEIYEVVKGELTMYIEGFKHVVGEGETITIKPGTKHKAFGHETWINVYSTPGWTPEDHILVVEGKEISRKKFDKKFKKT